MAANTSTVTDEATKVRIVIPLTEDDSSGIHSDPYEHVTINGRTTLIKRGEVVEVDPEVFIQLRNKYPYI